MIQNLPVGRKEVQRKQVQTPNTVSASVMGGGAKDQSKDRVRAVTVGRAVLGKGSADKSSSPGGPRTGGQPSFLEEKVPIFFSECFCPTHAELSSEEGPGRSLSVCEALRFLVNAFFTRQCGHPRGGVGERGEPSPAHPRAACVCCHRGHSLCVCAPSPHSLESLTLALLQGVG